MGLGLGILGLRQTRVRARARLRVLNVIQDKLMVLLTIKPKFMEWIIVDPLIQCAHYSTTYAILYRRLLQLF